MYSNALSVIKEHGKVGVGSGHFSIIYPLYQGGVDSTVADAHVKFLHNDYLELFVEHGLVGVLFIIVSIGLVAHQLLLGFRSKSYEAQLCAASCFSALVALFVLTSFSAPFWMSVVPVIIMLYFGAVYFTDSDKGVVKINYVIGPMVRWMVCLMLLSFMVWQAHIFTKDYRAMRSYHEFRKIDDEFGKDVQDLALSYALDARSVAPDFWENEFYLSLYYTALRKIDLAIDALDRALKSFPYNYRALCNRANLLEQRKQFHAAKADVELALRLSGHDRALWVSGLRLGLASGDNKFALKCAEELDKDSDSLQIKLTIAELLSRVEGSPSAVKFLEAQSVSIRAHKHALYLLAKFSLKAGDQVSAHKYLLQLRQVAPSYPVDFEF